MPPISVIILVFFLAWTTTLKQADGRIKAAKTPAEKEAPAAAAGIVVYFPPLPALPSLPSLPPFPAFPGFTPPPPSAPQPAHCVEYLLRVHVCLPYLTGASAAPPERCCENFRDLVNSSASICLCHVLTANPALNNFINGTIDQLRMFALPLTCSSVIPLQLALCFVEPLPPFP